MKKIITALAVAAFGVSAFAQEASVPAPERNFVVGAKFDFESRYVTQGKRRVNENTQTTISFKYFVPQTSDIGITPYAPSPNYGYIECGEPLEHSGGTFFKVRRFTEKPSIEEAERLLDNAEKSYRRALTVLRTLEGAKLVFKCEDIVNNLKD